MTVCIMHLYYIHVHIYIYTQMLDNTVTYNDS